MRSQITLSSLLRWLTILPLLGGIWIYRLFLSPFLGRQCRYLPTCSCYAEEALRRHGAVKGGWLTVRRLARCHPWGGSGYDPVPDADKATGCFHADSSTQRQG